MERSDPVINRFYRYNHSSKGKARSAKYRKTYKCKLSHERYEKTHKARLRLKKYDQSYRGKLRHKRYKSKPAVHESRMACYRSYHKRRKIRKFRETIGI